jgi:mRNA turnover protein 4
MLSPDERAPSSLQSELAKLGLPSKLVKGVPTLDDEYTLVKEGAKLVPNQVNLLKHFNIMMATVRHPPCSSRTGK